MFGLLTTWYLNKEEVKIQQQQQLNRFRFTIRPEMRNTIIMHRCSIFFICSCLKNAKSFKKKKKQMSCCKLLDSLYSFWWFNANRNRWRQKKQQQKTIKRTGMVEKIKHFLWNVLVSFQCYKHCKKLWKSVCKRFGFHID